MQRGRFLHTEKIRNHQTNGADVDLSVYGVFDTTKVEWKYYVISHKNQNGVDKLTSDICTYSMTIDLTISNVTGYGKRFNDIDEAKEFIMNYKSKWESGLNNTTQAIRDKKIDDVLG